MDKHYAYALAMTFVYSILGFINRNSDPENKANLHSKISWINAITKAIFDAGFAILFFSAITEYMPNWPVVLRVASAVFLAVFVAETVVETVKERITKWKI